MRFNILQKVSGSGSAPARKRFAYIAWLSDVVTFPLPDYRGVQLIGDIEMKENTGMMQIYLTSSTQEYTYETVGDADSKVFKLKFTGTHPGTEKEALEFAKNFHEEPFVILIPSCDSGIKILGSPDAPMIFTSSHKSEKTGEKFIFNFEQEIGSENVYQLYNGIITLNKNIEVDMGDFLEQLKDYIKLDGSNLTDTQKKNLRSILGLGENIGNSDLVLSENRSFNVKDYTLNFISTSGPAKVGFNKNNPEESIDVDGNIKGDSLILNESEGSEKDGSLYRKGDSLFFKTSQGDLSLKKTGDQSESFYKDGSIAQDIIKIVSSDGVEETYRETALWYDGTAITNARVDDDIFIKKGGKYYNKAIADNTSLKISNISQLRLTNGYYEGQEVTLLGYYNSGDKLPVTYKFTVQNYDTLVDDGGMYIKSSRGTWVAQFDGKASVKDFGALNAQNIDGILNKMLSITDINTVTCEKGVYRIPFANSVTIPANKTLQLHKQTEIRKAASAGFVPSIIINGDNAQLLGGRFVTEGNSLHEGTVVIRKGHKIKVDGPFFENSTIGIRVVPEVVDGIAEVVSNLDILNPEFNNCKYGVDFGKGVEGPVGEITDPFIFNMTFNNGKVIAEGGDGIKTRQKVSGLRVAFSYIDGPSRDCIDLFASGDGVRIYNCTFKNAIYKGIDIKREPGYDESIYGTNGERIAIVDTTFDNIPIGISVSGNYDAGNYKGNKYIRMQGNTFNKIATRSIVAAGRYLRIIDNDFINCSWNDTVNHPSIDIGQDTGVPNSVNSNIYINENTFTNCCSSIAPSLNTEAVIRIADYCKGVRIYDNTIENDTDKPRPNMYTGVYVNANSEAFFRNNTINVLGKPVHGVGSGATGARIVGMKIPLTLGTKPALFNRTQKVWKFDRKMQIISADISITTAVPADATNYSTGDVQVNGSTFIVFNTIAGVDTNLNRKLASTTNYLAQQDQDMQIRYNNAGTGQILENLTMIVNAVEC